jgi:hypothetical protein
MDMHINITHYIYISFALIALFIAIVSLILDRIEQGVEDAADELDRVEDRIKNINK